MLTRSERKIVELICTEALSNLEIAKRVGCAEKTVEIHMGNILKKTNCRNRCELILNSKKVMEQ